MPTTVSDVLERIGLSGHHWDTIRVTWWVWIFCGWSATTVVYLLDAAGEPDGDWTRRSSPEDRLTMDDKAEVLLVSGLIAAAGNQLLGIGSDVWGRIPVTEGCILNGVIAVFGFMLVRTKLHLLICICINPFLKDGAALVTNAMLAEWLPIEWRGIFIVTLHAFWNVGRLAITLVWAVIPPDEHWVLYFTVASTLPVALSIYLRIRGWRYESPRWLAVSGNVEGCIANLKLAADTKENPEEELPPGWDDPQVLKTSTSSGEAVCDAASVYSQLPQLMTPEIRYIVLWLCVIFFGLFYAALGYFYWLIEYLKMTGLNEAIVPCMIAAPIGKILANVGLIVGGRGVCLIDTSGRIPIMQWGFFGFGITIPLLFGTSNTILITTNVFIGHVFQEIIWAGGCLYVTEAFPTSVRNTASALIFTVGQLGGVAGSVVSGELLEVSVYLPMLIMSAWLFVAGFVCFVLPDENHDKALADSLNSARKEEYNSIKA